MSTIVVQFMIIAGSLQRTNCHKRGLWSKSFTCKSFWRGMNVLWWKMRVPRINLFWREWLDSSAVQLSDSSIYPPLQPSLVIRKQAWTDVEGMFVWIFYLRQIIITTTRIFVKPLQILLIGWIVPLHSRDPIFRAPAPRLLSAIAIVTALAWETAFKSAEKKKNGRAPDKRKLWPDSRGSQLISPFLMR